MNTKLLLATLTVGAALAFAGCSKEEAHVGGANANLSRKATLTEAQKREAQSMMARVPKLRLYYPEQNKFVDMNVGSRDYVFSDPDEGFSFDDPDNNGIILFSDNSGSYVVFNMGVGVAGQGGGGIVVAGNTTLNMDITLCISLEEVAEGDGGFADIFDSGFGFDEFGAVIGIAGDFEALADADTESNDFDPFEFFEGYAAYYVLSEDLSGSHEVFNWLENASGESEEDFDDFATSFVLDFQNMSLYFASSGTVSVSGGMMSFEGEYVGIIDLFESWLDGEDTENADVEIVSGFGSMGCN